MNGLYDGEFVGFKIASLDEVDTALREAVVAIDANVLLDLYRFRPQTSQDLIKTRRTSAGFAPPIYRVSNSCKAFFAHPLRGSVITLPNP